MKTSKKCFLRFAIKAILGMFCVSTQVYAINGTYTSPSLTLSSSTGCATATYTFSQKIPNTAGLDQTTSNVCTITFPIGTDATTCTGGTYAGTAIGTMTKTATSISFTCPVAVNKNTTFTIVLNNITNGNNISANASVSCGNSSGGTNSSTGYAFTTTACPLEITIGTGSSTLTYPYRGYYHDARSQFIITAAELSAQGLYGGCSLTSLAFNVSTKASTQAYTSFTIKIGHTASSTFGSATWLTPTFTTCYTGNYTTAVGWNTHVFTTNFTWNGTDNIVVETCFDNTSYTSDDPVYATSTAGNTVCYAYMDAAAGCSLSAVSTSSTRPNMKFGYAHGAPCSGTPTGGTASASPTSITCSGTTTLSLTGQSVGNGITYQWQSAAALAGPYTNIPGATTLNYTTASISSTTYYQCVVTCTNSGLSGTSSRVTVTVNNNVPGNATASPASVCGGSSSTLSLTGATISNSTYQWQSAPAAGGPWSDILGATSATYVATPSVTTYYRCVITCTATGSTSTSGSTSVTVTAGPTYAAIGYTADFETNWVSRCGTREIPTANWSAYPATGNNSWRRDDDGAAAAWSSPASGIYTPTASTGSRSARFHSYDASSGTSGYLDLYINLSTQTGTKILRFDYINTSGTDNLAVQLSTDGGGSFSTLSTLATVSSWTSYAIEIGSNSATCVIRFKATSDYGLTDIGIDNLSVVGPCSGVPTPGTASAANTTFCGTTNPLLTLTGYSTSGGITLQWQYSYTNSPYTWTDITGGTTAVFSAPAISQTTYYRCVVRCVADVAYSNIVTITNTAQSITSTNSPVSIPCNSTATLMASASGGTILWYTASSGGTPVGTGTSYTTPVITANTTYYCSTRSGTIDETAGMPICTGTYQSTSTNYGIIFNVTKAITLNSVDVYPNKKMDITVAYQNSAGVEQAAKSFTNINGNGTTAVTLALGWSIPVGSAYRLVLKTYTPSTGTGLTYSSLTSFPYTSPSGAVSVTSGWYGTGTSSTNYHFYNLDFSIPCESSPRTPVQIVVTSGVTAPVCSSTPSPATGATGVCPVGTTISWAASATACRAATGYKLYIGTDVAGTNLYNGLDLGNVTSYTFTSDLAGSTKYYWTIVPYNTAGNATGCTKWDFTTLANPGSVCVSNLGTGVTSVTLPYTQNNSTTQGAVDDLTSTNLVSCGNTSYFTGEDKVWYFTPATSGTINIALTSSGSYTGLALYEGCPLNTGLCGAPPGTCVATSQSSTGNKTMTACVVAGKTYYLILDSWASPTYNAYSKLTISAPSGTTIPANDLPCNAVALNLGVSTTGDNSCAGSASEPAKPTCWTSGISNTVWYKVVAPTSGQISVQTTSGTLVDTQIGLYSGACGSLVAVSGACNNDLSGCGSSLSSLMTVTGLTAGNTYYIAVDGAYDLQGTFSILAIDPATQSFPLTPGQDCSAPLPTCNNVFQVADPGYANTGAVCDFSGTGNCTGGERASVWYTINIQSAGVLQFDIVPTDYTGTPGEETDYDFLVWKTAGSGTTTDCATIATNSAQGLVACNYSYLGVTGLYPGGAGNPAYGGSVWDASYEPTITVAPGDQYLICISNYTLSTAGFDLDYSASGNVINTNAVPITLQWTGSTSTAYTLAANWGGCQKPTCAVNTYIYTGPSRWPVISTANEAVKDLLLDAAGQLTVNASCTLTVCGNFTNAGNVTINGTLEVAGNFVNTGTITFGAGSRLVLNGATPQVISLTSAGLTIPNLVINNTSGSETAVTLSGGNISITGTLALTSGIVVTSATSLISMKDNSTYTGGNTNNSFVSGPMQKVGDDAFVFPIGKSSKLAQLGIADPGTTTTDAFTAEYFLTGAPNNSTTLFVTGDYHCSWVEYWNITKDVGTHYPAVTLYWNDGAFSGIVDLTTFDLKVAHYNGTAWVDKGGNISGNTTSGSITSTVAFTSYSPLSFASKNLMNPLPVELIDITGKSFGRFNVINWQTASETNCDYFIVERSANNKDFSEVTKVKGAGNSHSVIEYTAKDYYPFDKYTYYRLKQVDFNGRVSYSKTISINTSLSAEEVSVTVKPNPFNDLINLELKNFPMEKANITVTDLIGSKYFEKAIEIKDYLTHVEKLDLSTLQAGMYFIIVGSGEYCKFVKVIKH